jgi:hypothetical protein
MSKVWIPVSPVEARAHPLYGRGGWLILFALAVLLMLVISGGFWALLFSARTVADSMVRFLGVYAAISAFAGLVILGLFIVKSPNFRIAATSLLLVPWPVLAGIYYSTVPQHVLLGGSALWLASVLVWVTYLQRSKRVRVTFEHCIAADAPDGRTEPMYMQGPGTRDSARAMEQQFDLINGPHAETSEAGGDPAEKCWTRALSEYDSGARKRDIWARAYAEAQGDEAAAKVHYLKLRSTQLFDEYQEQARELFYRQQAEREAAVLKERYEMSLTEHERKIMHAVEDVEAGGEHRFDTAVHLVNLLGGTVERRPSVLISSSGWNVELAGHRNTFTDDDELVQWVVHVIVPKARVLLPPRP